MRSGISVAEKLLTAAQKLAREGKEIFSAEDLVVTAWKMFPDAFGLQGYLDSDGKPIYPDSNRVYAEVMGSKPLRRKGLLKKVGNKLYSLTEAGVLAAETVGRDPKGGNSGKWSLDRQKMEQIMRLMGSKAAQKMRANQLDQIAFFDACGFWGISARSGAKELWARFAVIESLIDYARTALGSKISAQPIHGSNAFTAGDLEWLRSLHNTMKDKFEEDIQIIAGRTDERK